MNSLSYLCVDLYIQYESQTWNLLFSKYLLISVPNMHIIETYV